ncbi:MAG: hypothetical protein ACYC4H_09220 [Desulfocucumaceae bacterium]
MTLDKILMAEYELPEENINDVAEQLTGLGERSSGGEKVEYTEFQRAVRNAGYSAKQVIGILYARNQYAQLIESLASTPPEVGEIIGRVRKYRETGKTEE